MMRHVAGVGHDDGVQVTEPEEPGVVRRTDPAPVDLRHHP